MIDNSLIIVLCFLVWVFATHCTSISHPFMEDKLARDYIDDRSERVMRNQENGVRMEVAGWGKALLCSIKFARCINQEYCLRSAITLKTEASESFRHTCKLSRCGIEKCGIVRSFCGTMVLMFCTIVLSYLLLIWDHAAQNTKDHMAGKNSADTCQNFLESNRY